jgi:hypothetical protein
MGEYVSHDKKNLLLKPEKQTPNDLISPHCLHCTEMPEILVLPGVEGEGGSI